MFGKATTAREHASNEYNSYAKAVLKDVGAGGEQQASISSGCQYRSCQHCSRGRGVMEAIPALGQACNKGTRSYMQALNKDTMSYMQVRNKDMSNMQARNKDLRSF